LKLKECQVSENSELFIELGELLIELTSLVA